MKELYAALATAQGAFLPIVKNREVNIVPKSGVGSYKFRFADLEQLISSTRPALSANGLAVIQPIERIDGKAFLVTRLLHSSGDTMISEIPINISPDQDPKAYGAFISYMQRYAYKSMLSLAADDDLDEDGEPAGDIKAAAHASQQQERQQEQPAAPDFYDQAQFDTNFPKWQVAIETGKAKAAHVISMIESKAPLTDEQRKAINDIAVLPV